jgi:predicted ATP-dependent serine protease
VRSASPARCARCGNAETRLREAAKLGFSRAIVPAATARQVNPPPDLAVVGVSSVVELWTELFGGRRARAAGRES